MVVIQSSLPDCVTHAGNFVETTLNALVNFSLLDALPIYVAESLFDQTWYTGIALDPANRLKEHNAGKNRFTKGHRTWKIIFTEKHAGWQHARTREKYLKSAAGKRWLEKYLKKNGRDTEFPA